MRWIGWSLLALVLGVVVAVALAVWLRPLAFNARLERWTLRRAGLQAHAIAGPVGRIMVWAGGSGPPVVLLHGAGDQAGTWSKVVPFLVKRYRVIVPDLPGHGSSDPQKGPLDVGMMIDAVLEVMEAESDGQPVTLVGNSLGAWVAMQVAGEHPDRISQVVLVNGGPIRGQYNGPSLVPESMKEARALMMTLMGPRGAQVPDFVLKDVIRQAHHGPLARLAHSAPQMKRYLMDGHLDKVTVPVTLIWGGADGMFDQSYARRMLAELPHATMILLADCGHVPQRQCAKRFTEALLSVLQPATGASVERTVE